MERMHTEVMLISGIAADLLGAVSRDIGRTVEGDIAKSGVA